jgi:hypothetical protein
MVAPLIIAAAIGAAAKGAGAVADANAPKFTEGITEDDIEAALGRLDQGYGRAQDVYSAGGTIGDFTFNGGGYSTGKEVRKDNIRDAYKDFLTGQGFSEEYAAKRSKTAKGLNKRKAFKNFIGNEGEQYGLEVDGGNIMGMPKAEGFSLTQAGRGMGAANPINIDREALLRAAMGGFGGGY